jgi:hypothetical protein
VTTTDQFAQPTQGPTNPDDAAYSSDGKPDRWGRYRVPHPVSGRVMPWTRATTFAKTISDTYTLNMWGRRMTILGLVQRPDLYALAAQCKDPTDDKDKLNSIAEKAAEHAGSKSAANLGTALHGFTETHDRGEKQFVPEPWDRDLAAYRTALAAQGVTVVPGMIERLIVVELYSVAGTLDRIVRLDEPCPICDRELAIGDVKTGRTLEYGWIEIAVQLAIYAHADAIFDKVTKTFERMPEVCPHTALVFHLPVAQATCTVYDVNIQQGWELAGLCYTVRLARRMKDLAVPRAQTRTMDPGHSPAVVVDKPPTLRELIDSARTVKELSGLWAVRRDEWTGELTEYGLKRRDQIMAETAGEG